MRHFNWVDPINIKLYRLIGQTFFLKRSTKKLKCSLNNILNCSH
jgi:hypothetical protein